MSKLAQLFLSAPVAEIGLEDRTPETAAVVDKNRAPEEVTPPVEDAPQVVEAVAERPVADETTDTEEVFEAPVGEEVAFDETPTGPEDVARAMIGARQEREAGEILEASTEGLKEYRAIFQRLNETGGVDRTTLELAQVGLEAYTSDLNLPSIMLGVSLDSFNDVNIRQEVSLEHLDFVLEQFAATKDIVVQNIETATLKAGRALAVITSDLRGSLEGYGQEQDVAEVDADAVTAVKEIEAADDFAQERDVTESVRQAIDGVEEIKTLIVRENEAGGLSQETLVTAAATLEAFTKPLGLPEIKLIDSLEAFKDNPKVVIDTEGLNASLEGLIDILKKLTDATAARVKGALQKAKEGLGFLSASLPKTIEQLEAIKTAASAADEETTGEVFSKAFKQRLNYKGNMLPPAKLASYLPAYMALVDKCVGSFEQKSLQAAVSNLKLVTEKLAGKDAPVFSADQFLSKLDEIAAGWKDARSVFSSSDLSMVVPGSGPFFTTYTDDRYDGDSKPAKKLDEYAWVNVVTGFWVRDKYPKGKDTTVDALSRDQIVKLADRFLKSFKAADLKALEAANANTEMFGAMESAFQAIAKLPRAVRKTAKKELAVLNNACYNTFYQSMGFGWVALKESVSVAKGFAAYADASLATVKKASNEAFDSSGDSASYLNANVVVDPVVSLEAADIKKLRSGVKVKFSHGHGKISKVLTAPFMHGGKQHHASKDDPRFLVKHDKGGKDSIHKASALTIRE